MYFGGRHYSWSFLLAAVDFNILGVDFLQHFQLTVDVAAKQLRHHLDHITAAPGDSSLISSTTAPMAVPASGPARVAGIKGPSGSPATPQKAVGTTGVALHLDLQEEALLNTFTDVLNSDGRLPPATHGVEQHIGTNGRPVTAKFQRLDSSKLATRPLGGPPPVSAPPPALSSADFVFIKRGAPGPPLSPLYDSPYRAAS